jgi:hypothetical protein
MTAKLIHCVHHAGFPLPCVRCANPIMPSEASSVRARLPACTSAHARERRLAREAEVAKTRSQHD